MDYCPEIAILHGAFACVQAESKTGKYDLLHHTKGDKSSRPYLFIREVIREIIHGPETPHSQLEQKKWSCHLHQILFCKAFVFNEHFVSKETDEKKCSKALTSFKALCRPIPDFHPHMFFELSEEFEWTGFLHELLSVTDMPTAQNFAKHSLMFCTPAPALLYDLGLISTTLDFLLSALFSEIVHASETESATSAGGKEKETSLKDRDESLLCSRVSVSWPKYKDLEKQCFEAAVQKKDSKIAGGELLDGSEVNVDLFSNEEKKMPDDIIQVANQLMLDKVLEQVDQTAHDRIIQLTDLVTETLMLVQKRMSTKLFDRSSCKSGAMATVLPVLGHILASVIAFCVLSSFDKPSHQLRHCFKNWILGDEDDEVGSVLDNHCASAAISSSENESSGCEQDEPVDLVAEALARLSRTPEMRMVCMKCLSSFFAAQTSKGGPPQALSKEKSIKFGRVLRLNLCLCRLPKRLRFIRVVREFSGLLACKSSQEKGDAVAGLKPCILSILNELERREKVAEEKRLNPSLAEVMEKVQKKLSGWEWCIQYGLAKRDLKNWWFAGFLEFLHKNPMLLGKESDVRHLLTVLQQISLSSSAASGDTKHRDMCAEVIVKTISQLPWTKQDQLLIDIYKNAELLGLQIVPDFEQSVTITFNKLSASSLRKNSHDVLRLALHDLLTFTSHAVSTAISSKGQIPVVIQVLQQTPQAMRSIHPLGHPNHSLLCHCLHAAMHSHPLDTTEQRNCLNLVSLLVKPFEKDATQNAPLLSPAEFLSSSVLPFITLHTPSPLIPTDFALRLLIGCLDATLSVRFSDWLEDVRPAVVLACCAATLQECMEMMGKEGMEVERVVTVKLLVLNILDLMLKHFTAGGVQALQGDSLGWLIDRCAECDWSVCAYMASFLAPSGVTGSNPVIAEYVSGALKVAAENPAGLLRLSAISDTAATIVEQALHEGLHIPQMALLHSLSQVLPHLMVTEVCRVVQVLLALVGSGCVHMDLRHDFFLDDSVTDLSELLVSQLLTDAAVVIISLESSDQTSILPHVSQILVAALQALLHPQKPVSPEQTGKLLNLDTVMFDQVCLLMSMSPDFMLDPLFVVLLDLLASLSQREPVSGDDDTSSDLKYSLLRGITLIPRRSLRDTLSKKLEDLERLEKLEDPENLEKLEDPESLEKLEDPESLEKLEDPESLEKLEDPEKLDNLDTLENEVSSQQ